MVLGEVERKVTASSDVSFLPGPGTIHELAVA